MEKMIAENTKVLTQEQEQDVKAFAELPKDVRKLLLSFKENVLPIKMWITPH